MKSFRPNIWKTGLVMSTSEDVLLFGVYVLFMLFKGLSIADVSFVISVWLIVSSLGQIPAGVFADRFGFKKSMVIGSFINLLGTAIFAFSGVMLSFAIGYALMGFGRSMISGADNAMVYESLKKHNQEKSFKKIMGKIVWWKNIYAVFASILGAVLYAKYSEISPFVAQVGMAGIAFFATLSLKNISVKPQKLSPINQLRKSIKYCFGKKNFSKIFIFSGIIGSISITTFQYLQPLYKSLLIPEVYFGVFAAVAFLLRGIGGWYSDKLGKLFSVDHYLVLHASVFALLLILIQRLDIITVILAALCIMNFLRGLYAPTISNFINTKVSTEFRATALSMNSQVLFLTSALSMLLMGKIATVYDLKTVFFAISILSIVFLISYVVSLKKVESE